jgi:hypothetical protein
MKGDAEMAFLRRGGLMLVVVAELDIRWNAKRMAGRLIYLQKGYPLVGRGCVGYWESRTQMPTLCVLTVYHVRTSQ